MGFFFFFPFPPLRGNIIADLDIAAVLSCAYRSNAKQKLLNRNLPIYYITRSMNEKGDDNRSMSPQRESSEEAEKTKTEGELKATLEKFGSGPPPYSSFPAC